MEEETKITAKQRMLEAQGKEVPLDYFLYSCLEFERTVKAKHAVEGPLYHWPMLLDPEAPEHQEELEALPLSGLINRLCVWYRNEFPAMTDYKTVDFEILNEVVEPIVFLAMDMNGLYKLKTGDDLPEFEASVGNNKFWDEINRAVMEFFPGRGGYFLRYVQWSHASEPVDDFEPGSRPPVGRFAREALRGGYGSGSGPRRDRGGPGGGGGRDRGGPRRDRGGPGGGNRRDFGGGGGGGGRDRGERGDRGGGRGGRDRGGPGGGRGGPGGGRDRGDRRPREGGPENDANTQKLMDAAMAEVERAITELKGNPSVDEVTLKPINSYYRRLQHQRAIEMGYHSFSVGEGPDRSVKVARKE